MFTRSKTSSVDIASAKTPVSSSWLRAAISLFRRSSPLGIAIDDERKVFASVVDFELLLGSRTECPNERLGQLACRSTTQLCGSLKACQELIDKVDIGLQGVHKNPQAINELLDSLQLPRGARDHGWGYILHTLGGLGPAFDLYKVAALTKFRLYLTSVKSALMRATMQAATPGREKYPSIELNSKELVALEKASALTTRVPPQCVA